MKWFLSLAIIFLIACTGVSQKKVNKTPKLEKKWTEQSDNALLFRIEKEGAKTSYILGTMHLIGKEYYHFPKELEKMILKQDQVVMELSSMAGQAEMMSKLYLEEGKYLRDYFSKEQYDSVRTYFQENMAMDTSRFEQAFGKMKPFVLLQVFGTKGIDLLNSESIDGHIYEINDGKEIYGLETADQQLGFFDAIEKEKMAKMLMHSIHQPDTSTMMKRMQITYSKQDIKALESMLTREESMIDQDILLYDRNKAWIPQLEKLMADKSCFIAVGAGHLPGEEGVLNLLKQKGYKITGLKMKYE